MQGEDAWQFAARVLLAQTESILKSLAAVIQANGIDALVIDTVQFYAELGRSSWRCHIYTCQPHCILQKAIAEANGISVAADLMEESLGVTKKADRR